MKAMAGKISALSSMSSPAALNCRETINMVKVVQTTKSGGIDVLKIVSVELNPPAGGEVLLRQTAIGVNLIDLYHRTATEGQYAIAHPAVLGVEAAGDRKSGGEGKSVSVRVASGGGRIIKKKIKTKT